MGVRYPSGRVNDTRESPLASSRRPSPSRDPMGPIRTVCERIMKAWIDGTSGWMAGPDEVSEALARIIQSVQNIRSGEASTGLEHPPTRPMLDHRLCDLIRTELLRDWRSRNPEPPGGSNPDSADPSSESAEEFLRTLAALEAYRALLRPGESEELASRLAEPDAFELVVELAHDLRSPLNSILFLSEVLRSGHSGPVSDHQWKQLGLIYSASLGMVSVVSDVVELAGEARGNADDEPEPFSIGSVFENVERLVVPMAEEKGVTLEFRLPDYDRCLGHPAALGRVLLNLTTNALKFTDEGWVKVSADKVGRALIEFSVEDTGRGMNARDRERLFQPFRKSANRSGYFFSGSGLGLSIARRLLATMDSEIVVESERGMGSRLSFRVELPSV